MLTILFSEGLFFNFIRFRFWFCVVNAYTIIFIVGASSNLIFHLPHLFFKDEGNTCLQNSVCLLWHILPNVYKICGPGN